MPIKKVRFENCASFSHCISEINNTQVDDAKYIDAAMALYNLMEYSDIYSKTFESLWQYYIDETAWNNCRDTICFVSNINNSVLFKFKTGNDGTKDVETIVPLKDLSKILRTIEMLLIKFETDFILTWYVNFFTAAGGPVANQVATFAVTYTKDYFLVVILYTQDNEKLLQHLKSGFKRTIN